MPSKPPESTSLLFISVPDRGREGKPPTESHESSESEEQQEAPRGSLSSFPGSPARGDGAGTERFAPLGKAQVVLDQTRMSTEGRSGGWGGVTQNPTKGREACRENQKGRSREARLCSWRSRDLRTQRAGWRVRWKPLSYVCIIQAAGPRKVENFSAVTSLGMSLGG